ncbi:MAG TPA: hypothetical protein VMY06_08735 [Sedimentisphaerales bacterium]|nr:hypothetical protein [Sedimentisphaerales bacterium]
MINTSGDVKNRYTYDPFGEGFATELQESVSNSFQFAGRDNLFVKGPTETVRGYLTC